MSVHCLCVQMFMYTCGGEFFGNIFLKLLQCDDTKQRVTGRLTDGTAFPLMVQFASRRGLNKNHSGKVTVYTTLSGMISFLPNGKIHGCNHHFILMLTGYTVDQLKGQASC